MIDRTEFCKRLEQVIKDKGITDEMHIALAIEKVLPDMERYVAATYGCECKNDPIKMKGLFHDMHELLEYELKRRGYGKERHKY